MAASQNKVQLVKTMIGMMEFPSQIDRLILDSGLEMGRYETVCHTKIPLAGTGMVISIPAPFFSNSSPGPSRVTIFGTM